MQEKCSQDRPTGTDNSTPSVQGGTLKILLIIHSLYYYRFFLFVLKSIMTYFVCESVSPVSPVIALESIKHFYQLSLQWYPLFGLNSLLVVPDEGWPIVRSSSVRPDGCHQWCDNKAGECLHFLALKMIISQWGVSVNQDNEYFIQPVRCQHKPTNEIN